MATKILCFQLLLVLNQKSAKVYLIVTYRINANPSCDITIFVKVAQNVPFLFAFFLKISETLKAHISGTEADINKR